jgi:hypothetical protein
MTHILVALILLVACNQVSITIIESDREHDGFAGPVKKVFVWSSPISGGNYPVGSRCRQMTKVYDQHGRLMQHSLHPGPCGSDEIRYEYSYTPGGDRIEKSQKIRGGGSPPPPPPVALGSTPDTDKGEPRMWFMFDRSSGKIIESASYRPDGKIINKTRYTYDDKGRMTEMTGHNRDGRVSSRRVYGYPGDERVPSSFAYYDGKGNVYERTTYSDYKFNSQGDWVSRKEATEERLNRRSVSLTVREIEYHPSGK